MDPSDFGQACTANDECAPLGPTVECCAAAQCLGTCMVPCRSVEECPFDEMACEHGYCLFPCEANDADCADWPGFTCQHGGTLCESDV